MTGMSREGRAATASYIEDITAQLAVMSKKSEFHILTYFLEMARQEAAGLNLAPETNERRSGKNAPKDKIDPDAEELAHRFMKSMRSDR